MLAALVALVVPPRCAACRAPGRRVGDVLCAACRRSLPWLAQPCCPRCALPIGQDDCPPRYALPTGRNEHGCRARGVLPTARDEHGCCAHGVLPTARDEHGCCAHGVLPTGRNEHGCCAHGALPTARDEHACPARDAPFDAAWSAVAYDGVARDAMHALKFSAARPLAGVMAAQIAANIPAALLSPGAAIIPVPAHPARRRARGFDPAELIARALARRTGLAFVPALRRSAAPSRQLGASAAERRAPGRLDIRVRPGAGTPPAVVVLVDDVHTTGATLAACAAALRDKGCRRVAAVTWARALDEKAAPKDP